MRSVGGGKAGPGKWWVCREVFLGSLGSLVAPLGGGVSQLGAGSRLNAPLAPARRLSY